MIRNTKKDAMKIIHHELYDELVAEDGMTLVRKKDGAVQGASVALGRSRWRNGEALDSPDWETAEDYEEVPAVDGETDNEDDELNM